MTIQTDCPHCTIPTGGMEVCGFCATYTPPASVAQQIDIAVNRIDLIRADINKALRELPTDTPLFAVTDVVVALGYLRLASVALDKANDQIEKSQAVTP